MVFIFKLVVYREPAFLSRAGKNKSTGCYIRCFEKTFIYGRGYLFSLPRLPQLFWVKLVWQRLQVTVTTPLPRFSRSHALQPGHLKYLYTLRFLKRFTA